MQNIELAKTQAQHDMTSGYASDTFVLSNIQSNKEMPAILPAGISFSPTDELPDDAIEYYKQVESEVITELSGGLDPVLSEVTLKVFVSNSKGAGRRRKHLKEVQLIKYGHNYHQPHRFDWWIAGQELLGQVEDVETKLREIVLGNQAFNMNSQRRRHLS
jgi:hypothetical protein